MLLLASKSVNASEEFYSFDIPRQSADLSLTEFASQAKMTLIFPYDLVKKETANALKGRYVIAQAMDILLEGTSLHYSVSDDGQLNIYSDHLTSESNNMKKKHMALAVAGALSTLTTAATLAQEASQVSARGLEEVTVTARRKEENLQQVPDTVVALSTETIERGNIEAARDITVRIPNVAITESLSPTSTFLIVRGISSVRNSEPAVAVVVDGVQVGSASEVSQSFYDVEQIELLKGPQGALYGRNALGGALIITSKKPSTDFEGKFNIGVGSGDLYEATGSLSGGLTDELMFRVSGNLRSFGGTIENEYLNRVYERNGRGVTGSAPDNSYMDFEEDRDFRAQLLWEPTDQTSFDLRYAHNGLEAGAMWYRNLYRLETDPNEVYEFPINSNGNPTAVRTIDTLTLKAEHDFDFATFTSITNATDTNERYGVAGETRGNDRTGNVLFFTEPFVNEFIDGLSSDTDRDFFSAQLGDWAAGNFVGSDQYYDVQTVSQEFRLTGSSDKLDYVLGAYALLTDRSDTLRSTWETPNGQPFDCEPAYPGGPVVTNFACNGLIDATQNEQDNQAWAVFFSTDYDLSENLTLTVAGRYDEDQREVTRIDGPTVDTNGVGVGNKCDAELNPESCAAAGSKISETFSAFQPKVSLAYTPTDALTLYGTAARGFRSGGFNASGALLADSYDQETLDSFEIGFKSTLLGNQLRINGSAFHQRYENAQQFEFDGNIFVQSLYNIPESEINGVEFSLDYAISDSLLLSAGVGLMESEIVEFDTEIRDRMRSELLARTANSVKLPDGTAQAFDKNFQGEKMPNFPHQSANISLRHDLPLGANALITQVDYSYTADRYWWIDGQDVQDDVGLLSGSIAYVLREDLEVQLWCKNCLDEEYDSEYAPTEKELFGGAAKDVAYRARGITFGVQLKYDF
ncbi:TonB-dependent receptor [Gilvimarinus sp. SDUM040013]|uniref:TonB-dependent receptor n=1 Tax=Gilvimarinus gilvus TaxID=3058038 RepID=A0ABU4RY97_9GAMM|nr:TonB-dependent receptor [Gilvimarinus sp. SDUM040013]MDO3386235.1 TonB-dependent receptor [Gilvimarinus sp. SDUM040013]MDX6849770.1 TonB-dependent receptor [Gilvimarinus sp. SDUM040013]